MAIDAVGRASRASRPTLSDSIRVHLRFSGARASIRTMELREWIRRAEELERENERLAAELRSALGNVRIEGAASTEAVAP